MTPKPVAMSEVANEYNNTQGLTFQVDDEGDHSSTKLSSVNTSPSSDNERDEIEEVQKFAQKDTRRIIIWRFVIFGVLLATACTVTLTTWNILQKEQDESFHSAFEKFATTVGDAAVLQQRILRNSFRSCGDAISVDAKRSQIEWPFYTTPYFELYAGNALKSSGAEVAGLFTLVEGNMREEWVSFATENYEAWAEAGHMSKYGNLSRLNNVNYLADITQSSPNGNIPDQNRSEYWALWLYSPPPIQFASVNWNGASVPSNGLMVTSLRVLGGESVVTQVRDIKSAGTAFTEEEHDKLHSQLNTGSKATHPHSFFVTPIYEDPDEGGNSTMVAYIGAPFAWDVSLRHLLPDNVEGIVAIISNSCNQTYTYEISGKDAFYLGEGDLHETKYDGQKVSRNLSLLTHPLKDTTEGHCLYNMDLYPSSKFEESYDTRTPELFAGVVAITFVMVAVVFVVYDLLVHHRNMRLVQNAARSNAVVSALFPGKIRDQILEQQQQQQTQRGTKSKMKSFLIDGNENLGSGTKPLADLFLETTIMFADITGFTAWASVREPSQVFTLLETVYGAFDAIAKSRKVFKGAWRGFLNVKQLSGIMSPHNIFRLMFLVETVGDCYVAAAGIPEPRKDHATVIVRFARDCINRLSKLSATLELSLGPGTAELGIRVGVHSGPVTAGVLRGERARFQLFGDTMNVTARMESSSEPGRIQVSPDTAEIWANIKDQLVPQHDQIIESAGLPGDIQHEITEGLQDEKKRLRLIDWNVETLSRLIKQILARRQVFPVVGRAKYPGPCVISRTGLECPLDEVKEVIMLPEFDSRTANMQVSPDEIYVEQKVLDQLRSYVTTISHLYYRNPFHSFEHASHVVMSVTKLMSRIVAPDTFHDDNTTGPETNVAQSMHDHTYGITSDPLTQFACAFSALIHDVDHRGVPNEQLIKENEELGKLYRGRSVAEQNSLDLSWELLMESQYSDLRAALCQSTEELNRLRELVVNGVLATDIMDKELKALRNDRWTKAFTSVESCIVDKGSAIVDRNRKATIVIEHLIQASDVAHTMQHWHVYRQWNQRLFEEMYLAYKAGRAEKDPSEFWYKGEIGFFDYYIIPLAKKLKECGVFGVSSGEYLNYAENNRAEWERRGEEIVAEMVELLSK